MLDRHPFTIYSASAGSGKTFTLVKEYLKILFQSSSKDTFKHILAITFTNKAVGEMKERIIETLKQFSSPDILISPNSIFIALCEELDIKPEAVHKQSKTILNNIVYNYAAFDISTIDGFTHKIIRTFAHDLKLPINFEVELDQETLLNEAVDNLIAQAGTDKELTKTLVDFAIEKTDDDKSWDISYDFNKISKLLANENDIPFLEHLKGKTLQDFKVLKAQLINEMKEANTNLVNQAQKTLTLINECGLQYDDFSRSSLPKHFENLVSKRLGLSFDTNWQTGLINNESLYPKRVTQEIATIIDEIQPQLILAFTDTKELVFQIKFLSSFLNNITPLSVLNAINQELLSIKKEQNKMLISEFNTIISGEIKNQPTPFIYERLGEKFRHYFIDEFQDTSTLQWQNLIPLMDNTLSGENLKQEQGTAMLVGDAKQAIYRWRGGKAEQFIDLYTHKSRPFFIEQHVDNLPTNYRSFKEIIGFNNSFFSYLAETVFSNKTYSELYQLGATQKSFIELDGFVSIDFLDIEKDDNRDDLYPQKVLEIITGCLSHGFNLSDICVLVRKKKEGIAIAEFLSEHGITIMSSETMLIYNSSQVRFIDHFLTLLLNPNNDEIKIEVLSFLAHHFNIDKKHDFFSNHLKLSTSQLFKSFENFGVYINAAALLQLPLYNLAESLIRHFNLVETSNAYLQFYLDFVLEYMHKNGSNLSSFLEHFNKKKESLSIVSPQGQNAVQIMTIHKSKGLEFPIVIFPYADLNIYQEREPKEWFPLDKKRFNGFSHTLLNYKKEDFKNYGEEGLNIYNKHEAELELDNINLLYVALTRPIEQLYIISKKDISSRGIVNMKTYAGLLLQYLSQKQVYNESQSTYTFGSPKKVSEDSTLKKQHITHREFISTAKESHNIKIITNSGYLWDTNQQDAIEKGNLVHDIMSYIKTKNDIAFVLSDYVDSSIINHEQAKVLQITIFDIVNHTELNSYFTEEYIIYNERDIITKTGTILRPDRLMINTKNEAIIIDYKTGAENKKHMQQLTQYQDVLEEMGYKVIAKILVYINETINIVKA